VALANDVHPSPIEDHHMKITQRALLIVAAGAGATALLSGCTSTAAPAPGPTVTVVQTTAAPAVTVTATATVTKSAKAPSTAGYDAALAEWKKGAIAISADQGKNWSAAITDLTNGQNTDSDTTGYPTAITDLKQLISLPDAQQSPTENAAYHADINALNAFFDTAGLYS
jgi:hypothetical protein